MSEQRKIDFSPPALIEDDIAAVVDVLRSGWITTGSASRQFEAEIAAWAGTEDAVVLNSCTAALELALRLLGVGPGDEVIVPAYTYSASAAVVTHVGAMLVLLDSEPDDYAPSVDAYVNAVTPRTKAIIPVDLAGLPYPSDELRRRLRERGVGRASRLLGDIGRPVVLVDAAHSFGAKRGGVAAGSLGDLTAFSFHAVKNLTTAEGGALTWRSGLEPASATLSSDVRRLALHGQSKDALAKHTAGAWEYDIIEPGYKANLPDVLAALGLSQVHRYAMTLAHRRSLMGLYRLGLVGVVSDLVGSSATDGESSVHLAMVRLLEEDATRRNDLVQALAVCGVSANVHYKPLPLLSAYQRLGFDAADYPHATAHFEREITLPLHGHMTPDDVAYVLAVLCDLLGRQR